MQNRKAIDIAAIVLVANKKRIYYTRRRGGRPKTRAVDRRLHPGGAPVVAVGWKEFSGFGVSHCGFDHARGEDHGED